MERGTPERSRIQPPPTEANGPNAIRNLLQAMGAQFEPSWANGKLIKLAEYSGIPPPNISPLSA
ncbi:hypothetical protein E4U61_000635 [Claviceps capensis]|nr:hypothetical protein E4U61_000635 [Claviceps capensis]